MRLTERHRQIIHEHGPLRPSEVARLRAELDALKVRSAEIEQALDIVPKWEPDIRVEAGETYADGGSNWKVVQGHTTANHWRPGLPGLDALWQPA